MTKESPLYLQLLNIRLEKYCYGRLGVLENEPLKEEIVEECQVAFKFVKALVG